MVVSIGHLAHSSFPALNSPHRIVTFAPIEEKGSGGRRLGFGFASMEARLDEVLPNSSSAVSLPDNVPIVVPRPF